ncbi:hypothetical protein Bca4012_016998 [Brassica carinata]
MKESKLKILYLLLSILHCRSLFSDSGCSFKAEIFGLLDLSRMVEPIYELSRSLSFTKRFDQVLISRLASSRCIVTFYLRQRPVMFYLRHRLPGCRLKN